MDSSGVIRRLAAFACERVRDHLSRLDDADRRLRFGGPAGAAGIAAHGAGLDPDRTVVLGYIVAGEARAIGGLRPLPGVWPRAAEAAISVERPFQGRGIGTTLLRRVTVAARNRWIRRLHLLCLLDNGRMMRLARRLAGQPSFDQGQVAATLELPWPTGWTVLEALAAETAGWPTRPVGAWPACGARSRPARACAGGPSAA